MATRQTGGARRKPKSAPKPKPVLTPEEEEREAKRKLKMAENKKKAAQQRSAAGRAEIIREILRDPSSKNCKCPIKPSMTLEELKRMMTCTESLFGGQHRRGGGWICPTADRIRRRLGH